MEIIAERRLVALFEDPAPVQVCLRVGRPVKRQNGDFTCLVEGEGLRRWQGPSEIFGVDSWQALMLGLRFIRMMLQAEVKRGAVFHYEGGERPVSVEELFVLVKSE